MSTVIAALSRSATLRSREEMAANPPESISPRIHEDESSTHEEDNR